MAKDKNNKKKKDKQAVKDAGVSKATDTLKALAQNPLVADVVAAALVATASALKDSNRARALASDAADEISRLSKNGAKQGDVLWDMAVQIGRRSLAALMSGDSKLAEANPAKAKAKPSAAKKAGKKKKASANARP